MRSDLMNYLVFIINKLNKTKNITRIICWLLRGIKELKPAWWNEPFSGEKIGTEVRDHAARNYLLISRGKSELILNKDFMSLTLNHSRDFLKFSFLLC